MTVLSQLLFSMIQYTWASLNELIVRCRCFSTLTFFSLLPYILFFIYLCLLLPPFIFNHKTNVFILSLLVVCPIHFLCPLLVFMICLCMYVCMYLCVWCVCVCVCVSVCMHKHACIHMLLMWACSYTFLCVFAFLVCLSACLPYCLSVCQRNSKK